MVKSMCLPDLWKKLPEKLRRYTLTKENLGEPYLSSNHHINQNQSAYQLASISIHQHIEVVWKVALGRSFCQSYKLKLYFDFSPFQLFPLANFSLWPRCISDRLSMLILAFVQSIRSEKETNHLWPQVRISQKKTYIPSFYSCRSSVSW